MPAADTSPAVSTLPPVTLPVELTTPAVSTLPPAILPVAVTLPAVIRLPPVTVPVAETVADSMLPAWNVPKLLTVTISLVIETSVAAINLPVLLS